jgi:hypothetical protein
VTGGRTSSSRKTSCASSTSARRSTSVSSPSRSTPVSGSRSCSGLKWKDIDLDKHTVYAGDQIDEHGQLTGRTKSDSRTAYIPPQVARNLKAHWLSSLFKAKGDFVFASASGRPMSQKWARRVWMRLVELAEQLGDSVQVALSTYASLFGRVESEDKLRGILEASNPVSAAPGGIEARR